jgi:RHS repeat-associated protein
MNPDQNGHVLLRRPPPLLPHARDLNRANLNYFRDYDPQTGRYLESDQLGLFGGSLSTYSYTNDNPIMYIDPLGLCWIYSQSTGQLTHVDADGNVDYTTNGGYSGYGTELNNPVMESVQAAHHGDPAGGQFPLGTTRQVGHFAA